MKSVPYVPPASAEPYLGDQGFVFDPVSGHTFSMNECGAFLFQRIRSGIGPEELLAEVLATFDVDSQTAGRDLDEFARTLRQLELGG